jgi:hypothetical protein
MQRLQRFAPALSQFLDHKRVWVVLLRESDEPLARRVFVINVGKYQLHTAAAISIAYCSIPAVIPGSDRRQIYRHTHSGRNRPAWLLVKKTHEQTDHRTDQVLNFEMRSQFGVFAQMAQPPCRAQ